VCAVGDVAHFVPQKNDPCEYNFVSLYRSKFPVIVFHIRPCTELAAIAFEPSCLNRSPAPRGSRRSVHNDAATGAAGTRTSSGSQFLLCTLVIGLFVRCPMFASLKESSLIFFRCFVFCLICSCIFTVRSVWFLIPLCGSVFFLLFVWKSKTRQRQAFIPIQHTTP